MILFTFAACVAHVAVVSNLCEIDIFLAGGFWWKPLVECFKSAVVFHSKDRLYDCASSLSAVVGIM